MHIVILGAPGSGKGTQSSEITKHFNIIHLSTGDMLRKEIKEKSELGIIAKQVIDSGNLVSDDLILKMVTNIIKNNSKGILFDGFPRTIAQAKGLDDILSNQKQIINHAIQLDVDQEMIIKRMLSRGREDDNEETIKNRLDVYQKQTSPLIEFYKNQNKLIKINGMGDVDSISLQIREAIS